MDKEIKIKQKEETTKDKVLWIIKALIKTLIAFMIGYAVIKITKSIVQPLIV